GAGRFLRNAPVGTARAAGEQPRARPRPARAGAGGGVPLRGGDGERRRGAAEGVPGRRGLGTPLRPRRGRVNAEAAESAQRPQRTGKRGKRWRGSLVVPARDGSSTRRRAWPRGPPAPGRGRRGATSG